VRSAPTVLLKKEPAAHTSSDATTATAPKLLLPAPTFTVLITFQASPQAGVLVGVTV
jgi:hypothetical protein